MKRKIQIVSLLMGFAFFYACGITPESGDTTPPELNLTEPVQNSIYCGSVTFKGTASDDVAVASVEVSIASGDWVAAEGLADWSYPYNFGLVTNDTRNVRIRAKDTSQNVTELSLTLFFGNATNVVTTTNVVSVITNYLIETNYVYVSNDVISPVVAMTSAASFYEPVAAVSGAAMDVSGVQEVWLSTDGATFAKTAMTMNGSTSYWSTNLNTGFDASLTVSVFAVDFAGNVSLTNGYSVDTITPSYVCVSTGGSDSGYGTILYPYLSLQKAAATAAATPGRKTILVQSGVYTPGAGLNSSGIGVSITNSHSITLSGGWNSNFTAQTGTSVLDGQRSVYHVIYIGTNITFGIYSLTNMVVENFTIINGFANGTANSAPYYNQSGAGIMVRYARVQIRDCVLTNNIATNSGTTAGGAICVRDYSCDIRDNFIAGNLSAGAAVCVLPSSTSWGTSLIQWNTVCSNTTIGPSSASAIYVNILADVIGNEVFENAFVDQLFSPYSCIWIGGTYYADNSRCISNIIGSGGSDYGWGLVMMDDNSASPNFTLMGNAFITNKMDCIAYVYGGGATATVNVGATWTIINSSASMNNLTTADSTGNTVTIR